MVRPNKTVNIHEAKTHFSALVSAASEGREVLIAKSGKPVARLTGLQEEKRTVRFGLLKGKIWIADDFDAPHSSDLIDLFENPQ